MAFTSETARAAGSKPKKAKIITTALVAKLNAAEGSKLLELCDTLINLAVGGDVAAIKEIFDRVEGKAPQPMEHEGEVAHVHYGARELLAREYTRLAAGNGSPRDAGEANGSAVH